MLSYLITKQRATTLYMAARCYFIVYETSFPLTLFLYQLSSEIIGISATSSPT